MPATDRGWRLWLGAIAAVGLLIRLVYVFAFKGSSAPVGDGGYYHHAANLLADGHGFIQPDLLALMKGVHPAADHPPGYIVALAVPSAVGLHSVFSHRVWSSLLGTVTVVVAGLLGRRVAGPRAGLLAAGLAAVYPNFWLYDGLVMSETLVLLTAALTLLAAYRFAQHPGLAPAATLGFTIAVFALTRAEGVLLLLLLALPLCLTLARVPWRGRLRLVLVVYVVALATMAPWVGYNLTRFHRPVFVTTGLGFTMSTANCGLTYHGELVGYWSYFCPVEKPATPATRERDLSDLDVLRRQLAIRYIRTHSSALPSVELARLGRTWGFYRPLQQVRLDSRESGRNVPAAWFGLGLYFAMLAASIWGALVLRRRGITLIPVLALVVLVTIAVVITFGQTRYRAPAEIALVLLTAVAVDAAWRRRSSCSEGTLNRGVAAPVLGGSRTGPGNGFARWSGPAPIR